MYNTDDKRFKRYIYVKRRIAKAQGAAKTIGMFYLFAAIAVIALFCIGVCKIDFASLTVYEFYDILINPISNSSASAVVACAVVYAAALLAMVICLIVALTKLRWLFVRKASRLYGFNRNMYAMDDLGKCFSYIFATGLAAGYFIALTATGFEVAMFGYIYVAVGLVAHFALGLMAGSVSLFDTTEGITEQKREVGYFAPFMRNVIQLIVTGAMLVLFVQNNAVYVSLDILMIAFTEGQVGVLFSHLNDCLIVIGQIVLSIALLLMIFSATSTKEFDLEGAETPGRKLFLLWVALAFAGAAASAVGFYLTQLADEKMLNVFIYTAIALVAVIVELCTIGCPHVDYEKLDDMDAKEFIRANANNNQPNVYMHYEVNNATATPNNYTVYGLDE